MSRLFLSVPEKELERIDLMCAKTGMTRSQYFSFLLSKRHDVRPPVLQYRELIHELDRIDRDLKVIAMKEELSDEDRLLVMTKLSDLKDILSGRFHKEDLNGN